MTRSAASPLNGWDVAKLIALGLMFVDHIGHFLFPDQLWLRAIGRGAAPIFLFLAGFASSYRFNREILGLALLLTVSDTLLVGHLRTQNILFAILASRLIFDWLERRGKTIERPYEWYIGSIAMMASIWLVQYGSIGFLFAVCGYMQRRKELYSETQRWQFMLLCFVTYGLYQGFWAGFPIIDMVVMTVVLCHVYQLLWGLETKDVPTGKCPPQLVRLAKLASYYSGYIYVFHLIALEWMTGIPL